MGNDTVAENYGIAETAVSTVREKRSNKTN